MSGFSPAYAFSLGMVAAVNPCGFALLPAYLSYYLGIDSSVERPDDASRRPVTVIRSMEVGGAMTAGFVLVFGVIGTVWSSISSAVGSRLPWVMGLMGLALIGLGIAMILGHEPTVRLPKLVSDKGDRQVWSMFVFGVSYAVASLSCTIPLFVGAMSTSFGSGFATGVATFVMYALGMGALITVLTVAVGMARTGIVRWLRRLLPYVGRVAGALTVGAGAFVVYVAWADARQLAGRSAGTGAFATLQRWQNDLTNWLLRTGPTRIGVVIAVLVGAAVAGSLARQRAGH